MARATVTNALHRLGAMSCLPGAGDQIGMTTALYVRRSPLPPAPGPKPRRSAGWRPGMMMPSRCSSTRRATTRLCQFILNAAGTHADLRSEDLAGTRMAGAASVHRTAGRRSSQSLDGGGRGRPGRTHQMASTSPGTAGPGSLNSTWPDAQRLLPPPGGFGRLCCVARDRPYLVASPTAPPHSDSASTARSPGCRARRDPQDDASRRRTGERSAIISGPTDLTVAVPQKQGVRRARLPV